MTESRVDAQMCEIYANYLNDCLGNDKQLHYLMPIKPTISDLSTKICDGVLLSKFINYIEPNTIDFRAIHYHKNGEYKQDEMIENQTLNINAAKSIGIAMSNAQSNTQHLIHPEMNRLCVSGLLCAMFKRLLITPITTKTYPNDIIPLLDDGEDITDLIGLSSNDILLRWVNHHLPITDKRIGNFGYDIKDGKVLMILLKSISNDTTISDTYTDTTKRIQAVIHHSKQMGINTPFLSEDNDSSLNELYIAQLFRSVCTPYFDPQNKDMLVHGYCRYIPSVYVSNDIIHLIMNWIAYHWSNSEEMKQLLFDKTEETIRNEEMLRMWIISLGFVHTSNLFIGCRDGLLLLRLLDKVYKGIVQWKYVEKRPRNKFKKLGNANYAVVLGKQLKIPLKGIGGSDIVDRNETVILYFLWEIRKYALFGELSCKYPKQFINHDQATTMQDLIYVCNYYIANSELNIRLQIESWFDEILSCGIYFICLIASLNKAVVNWNYVIRNAKNDNDKKLNAMYALSVARKMGCNVFVVPNDIVLVRAKMCMDFCASILIQINRVEMFLP